MAKAAIVILAGTGSHEGSGRAVNGLEAAKEFKETEGDDVEIIFDGAGTQWVPEFEDPDHDYHDLYQSVKENTSACDHCAGAFGVEDAIGDAGVNLVDDYEGHPSIRDLVDDDYQIITF